MNDHEERLRAMLADVGDTWDLSPNDRAAIRWVLAEIDRLRKGDDAARWHGVGPYNHPA